MKESDSSKERWNQKTDSCCKPGANTTGLAPGNQPPSSTTEARSSPAFRARQVLVDRLGIITEQAPPYCPSAKGTVEAIFRWMTQRFERRLPNTSFGVNSAQKAAEAGGMTLEELERYFIRAIVDDYQQSWDGLRRQKRDVLWEEAVRQTGVPQYLGAPDDLKLLLMKAQNRKVRGRAYHVHDRSRLSFQGNWYVSVM